MNISSHQAPKRYIIYPMVEVKRVSEEHKQQWDRFVAESPNGHILQSWEWGDFRETWGTPPIRVAVFEDGRIRAACSFTLHRVPLINKYVGYCGKGPVFEAA